MISHNLSGGFVLVGDISVWHPSGIGIAQSAPGKIDTGAHKTVLPRTLATALHLRPLLDEYIDVINWKGVTTEEELYVATLSVSGIGRVERLKVVVSNRDDVLIGVDFLARANCTLFIDFYCGLWIAGRSRPWHNRWLSKVLMERLAIE